MLTLRHAARGRSGVLVILSVLFLITHSLLRLGLTDWALGRFLDQARTRPWLDNTVFVIVADHYARSSGRTELPIANFRIPLFIYAPAIKTGILVAIK